MLTDMGHSSVINGVLCEQRNCVKIRHIKLTRQTLFPPHVSGEAGSYPVFYKHRLWTGSELVPSLGASLGPNPASPLIRGGARERA